MTLRLTRLCRRIIPAGVPYELRECKRHTLLYIAGRCVLTLSLNGGDSDEETIRQTVMSAVRGYQRTLC